MDAAVLVVVWDAASHDDPRQCERSEPHINTVLNHVVEVVHVASLRRLCDARRLWIAV